MHTRGFTLLEMLIAIAIFSLVTVIALGAIVMLFSSYSKSQSTQVLVDNLNFTLESITRDIRFGKSYALDGNSSIQVQFEDNTILYELEVDVDGKGRIKRSEFDENENLLSETFATAKDIDIETLDIRVEGTETGDGHPRATFLMKGTLIRSNQQSTFALQTTVSQRESEDLVTVPPANVGTGGDAGGDEPFVPSGPPLIGYVDPNGDGEILEWTPIDGSVGGVSSPDPGRDTHYTYIDDGMREIDGDPIYPDHTDYLQPHFNLGGLEVSFTDIFEMETIPNVQLVEEINVWVYQYHRSPGCNRLNVSIYVDGQWLSQDVVGDTGWDEVPFTGSWNQDDLDNLKVRIHSIYYGADSTGRYGQCSRIVHALYAEIVYWD